MTTAATVDKMVKAVEALKLMEGAENTKEGGKHDARREKMQHCSTIADVLVAPATASKTSAADFSKSLTVSMEQFFSLLDDCDLDVRTVAEESINRVINSIRDSHSGRLQVELYKEIKRTGSARCLSVALAWFSRLARLIRPQKCRAFVVNLMPPIVKVAARKEEAVMRSLADSSRGIFEVLGPFATDAETRALLRALFDNLFDRNDAALRRAAAECIANVASLGKNSSHFLHWTLGKLLDFLMEREAVNTPSKIIGVLLCAKLLIPKIYDRPEVELSRGESVDETPEEDDGRGRLLAHRLMQLYEFCLHFIDHENHSVVVQALETMHQMLSSPPACILPTLVSPGGITRSYISFMRKVDGGEVTSAQDEEKELLMDLDQESKVKTGRIQMKYDSIAEEPLEETGDESRTAVGPGDNLSVEERSIAIKTPDSIAAEESEEVEGIGGFCDGDIPLIYCSRKITFKFLLTREKGVLTPDRVSRISTKVLAMNCLTAAIRLCPKIFLITLFADQDDADDPTIPVIRDVCNYAENYDETDPQLVGSAALLMGTVMHGALVESAGNLELWFNGRRIDHLDIVDRLKDMMLTCDSAITMKMALTSAGLFLGLLCQSQMASMILGLLEIVPALSRVKYWLVRQELCDLVAKIPFAAVRHVADSCRSKSIKERFRSVVFDMLGDEDARVRGAAASSLVRLSTGNMFDDDGDGDVVVSAASDMARELLHPIVGSVNTTADSESVLKGSPPSLAVEIRVYRLVAALSERLVLSENHRAVAGCIEALDLLAEKFPSVHCNHAWGSHVDVSDDVGALSSPALDLLGTLVAFLTKSSVAHDLQIHSKLISLSGRLCAGLFAEKIRRRAANGAHPDDVKLESVANELLFHCVKIFAIVSCVMEGGAPPPLGTPKNPLQSITNPSLSPMKKKVGIGSPPPQNTIGEKQQSLQSSPSPSSLGTGGSQDAAMNLKSELAQDGTRKIGFFGGSPHYGKILDVSRGVFAGYRVAAAGDESFSRFTAPLRASLRCLSSILELSANNSIGKNTEEILSYLKTNLTLHPYLTLGCVQSLLRCIFKTNVVAMTKDNPDALSAGRDPGSGSRSQLDQRGMFHPCFDVPYNELVQVFHLSSGAAEPTSAGQASSTAAGTPLHRSLSSSSLPLRTKSSLIKNLGSKTADRAALASYIRLFEPMVIRALKLYTLSSDAEQQSQVLELLIQLVQLRVNYCLLDSDQVFIGFVIKQVELVENGEIPNAERVVPNIFRFLVLLSYEKNHSKPIIDVPKILNLCEGLFASGQPPQKVVLPALIPVAEDLFLQKNNNSQGSAGATKDPAELETQRECVLNMLLKLIIYPEAMEIVITVIGALRNEGEEKWRKISRMIADFLIPLLTNHKIHIHDKTSLDLLRTLFASLAPGSLRPVDPLLAALLTSCVDLTNIDEVERWLSFVVVTLPVLATQSPEEGILGRLEHIGLQIGSVDGDSLLNSSMESSSSSGVNVMAGSLISEGGAALKPEAALARFLVQVVGAACSKLHQMVYTQPEHQRSLQFLQQLLSHLLLLVTYMFQSGKFVRVTRAAKEIADKNEGSSYSSSDLASLYTFHTLSELFLQLAHHTPYLTLQWLYVLLLLDWCPQDVWARAILSGGKEASSGIDHIFDGPSPQSPTLVDSPYGCGLFHSIVRLGGLILYCDFLCDNHSTHVESTTWIVRNRVAEIVACLGTGENPVREFVSAMHRSPASSGLLFQAIASKCDSASNGSVALLRDSLNALSNAHSSHDGKLVLFLVRRFLAGKGGGSAMPVMSLVRSADAIACKKVEGALKESTSSEMATQNMQESDVAEILDLLRSKSSTRRHVRLATLLDKLVAELYMDLSPIDAVVAGSGDDLSLSRSFNPTSLASMAADKEWFTSLVRQKCYRGRSSSAGFRSGEVCARLLSSLEHEEILEISKHKDFNLEILRHCIVYAGSRITTGSAAQECGGSDAGDAYTLFEAVRESLFLHVEDLTSNQLPKPFQVFRPEEDWNASPGEMRYTQKLEATCFEVSSFRQSILHLMSGFVAYMESDSRSIEKDGTLVGERRNHVARFSVLSLEYLKWLVCYATSETVPAMETNVDVCLRTAALALENPQLSEAVSALDNGLMASSCVLSLHSLLKGPYSYDVAKVCMVPKYKMSVVYGAERKVEVAKCLTEATESPSACDPTALAAIRLNEMFSIIVAAPQSGDERGLFQSISKTTEKRKHRKTIERLLVGLARMPIFNTYIRVPPEIWTIWTPEVNPDAPTKFPLLPVEFLEEIEILSDYVLRTNKLGWEGRHRFEEIWVSLLAVFSISYEELSDAEVKALTDCSAMVVEAITALVMQTLILPKPGWSGNSKSRSIHHSRDVPSQFLLSPRGQQLTSIQNFIQDFMECRSGSRHFLRVDSSANLERCCCEATGGSDWGLGQLSVGYAMNSVRHKEENRSGGGSSANVDTRSTRSSQYTAYALPFLLREEQLASSGVDLDSCLHFLFELYAQWMKSPSATETPLTLLTETVRSTLVLSDVFTESGHFRWMGECFLEVLRVHPSDDESLNSLLTLGICKALAITGCAEAWQGESEPSSVLERTRKALDSTLKGSSHLSARTCALHGLLYLLQSEVIQAEELVPFLPLATDYLRALFLIQPPPPQAAAQSFSSPSSILNSGSQNLHACERHLALMWSLAFYLMENYEHEMPDKDWCSTLVQLAISTAGKSSTPHSIYLLLLSGIERLVVAGKLVVGEVLDQVNKLSTDLLTESNPSLVIPAVQLFLACMYSSTSGDGEADISIDTPSGGIEDPERLMRMMEQVSILFDCVRRSGPLEARLICDILPRVLVDFFPPADVVNRVVTEFMSPGQPHQVLLSGVLFSVFRQAAATSPGVVRDEEARNVNLREGEGTQAAILLDWVLSSLLPNFTRRRTHPISHSVWCLTCFFVSALAGKNAWMEAVFPQLQQRFGFYDREDRRLFCLAGREFYRSLVSWGYTSGDRERFIATFEEAAAAGEDGEAGLALSTAPYQELLRCCRAYHSAGTIPQNQEL